MNVEPFYASLTRASRKRIPTVVVQEQVELFTPWRHLDCTVINVILFLSSRTMQGLRPWDQPQIVFLWPGRCQQGVDVLHYGEEGVLHP